jgi:hypothetical protein
MNVYIQELTDKTLFISFKFGITIEQINMINKKFEALGFKIVWIQEN